MPEKKTGKRKRSRTHPGVLLMKVKGPGGRPRWRAKWVDPRTGKTVWRDPARDGATNPTKREKWAVDKSEMLRLLRARIDMGEEPEENPPQEPPQKTTMHDAVEGFYQRRAPELRPSTVETYRKATDVFVTWADAEGISHAEDLRTVHLDTFRSHLITRPLTFKRKATGTRKKGSTRKRSPGGVNKDLRSIRALVNDLRRVGLLPGMDSDGIRDGLRAVKAPRPVVTFLRGPEIRALLKATLRHDKERFRETRPEHAGVGEPGSTPRYLPVAAFAATVVLTGARFGEIASLRWDAVDLEAGEIVLAPEDVKTHHGRRIPLDVTPGLWELLRGLRLQSGGRGPYIFGADGSEPYGSPTAAAALRRLPRYGAPEGLSWQLMRRTCAAHLASAPGVYGAAAAFHAAKRLGHSVVVAERHYAGAISDISPEARTIEAAMGVEPDVDALIRAISGIEPTKAVAGA